MAENPIKYSDLINPDDSIQRAIDELSKLKDTFTNLSEAITKEAKAMADALKTASGATEESRKVVADYARKAEQLVAIQKEIAALYVEVAKREKDILVQTRERVGAEKEHIGTITAKTKAIIESEKAEQAKAATQKAAAMAVEAQAKADKAKLSVETELARAIAEQAKAERIKAAAEKESALAAAAKAKAEHEYAAAEEKRTKTALAAEKAEKAKEKAAQRNNVQLRQQQSEKKYLNILGGEEVKIADLLTESYDRLSAQYSLNKLRINAMTEAERANNRQMIDDTKAIYEQMKVLQASTGNYSLNVGNYKNSLAGLERQVTQLARELPSLAISADMFFMAISNNLPYFFDEIKLLKEQNKLAGDGISIWKALGKSMLSWNVILSVGITLLTVFGGKIVDWVKGLFSAKKASEELAKAQRSVNDAMVAGAKNAVKETAKLNVLYSIAKDATRSMNERNAAVNTLKEMYPQHLKNLDAEAIKTGKIDDVVKQLTADLVKSAKAMAAFDKITEIEGKKLDLEFENIKSGADLKAQEKERDRLKKQSESPSYTKLPSEQQAALGINYSIQISEKQGSIDDLREKIDENDKLIAAYDSQIKELEKMVGVDVFAKSGSGKVGGSKDKVKEEKDYWKYILDLRREAEDDYIAQMPEWERKEEDIRVKYNRKREDLIKGYNDYQKEISEESAEKQKEYTTAALLELNRELALITQQKNDELEALENQHQQAIIKQQNDTIALRLQAVEKGGYEEYQLRLKQIENEQKLALLENDARPAGQRQSESSIIAAYDKKRLDERTKFNEQIFDVELKRFDAQKEIAANEFEMLKSTEWAKTRFQLEAEKERIQKILALHKELGLNLSDEDKAVMEAQIANIDKQIKDSKIDERNDAIRTATQYAVDSAYEYIGALEKEAEAKVNAAEKEVDASQSALDAEREAKANGYASNVEEAQRELELNKRTLDKAQKEQERAQKAQLLLQTAQQASDLVSATSKIWAQLGFPFAIPAIAVMWGSFAAAKIKALTMTKSGTEKYGEGTVELLEGGSHQSGNDIDLGTKKDGTRRRAEGGEFFAVINKRNSRRFRREIPEVIGAFNNGTFAEKYAKAYNGSVLISNTADFGNIGNDVREIKEQRTNEKRYYNEGNYSVMTYKNITRRVRL